MEDYTNELHRACINGHWREAAVRHDRWGFYTRLFGKFFRLTYDYEVMGYVSRER